MFKSILKIIKKIVISIIVLYGYNIITQPFNLNIPINVFTIGIITLFDTSGFLGMVLFLFFNFK
jgi:hypothetical protein